jgi:hypothetical protein
MDCPSHRQGKSKATQKPKVHFIAPIEYDHYGENNPEQTYLDAKQKVLEINPRAGFIRSDIQDGS